MIIKKTLLSIIFTNLLILNVLGQNNPEKPQTSADEQKSWISENRKLLITCLSTSLLSFFAGIYIHKASEQDTNAAQKKQIDHLSKMIKQQEELISQKEQDLLNHTLQNQEEKNKLEGELKILTAQKKGLDKINHQQEENCKELTLKALSISEKLRAEKIELESQLEELKKQKQQTNVKVVCNEADQFKIKAQESYIKTLKSDLEFNTKMEKQLRDNLEKELLLYKELLKQYVPKEEEIKRVLDLLRLKHIQDKPIKT